MTDRPDHTEAPDEAPPGQHADQGNAALNEAVEAALRKVRDPDADVNVFEAGLIENVRVAGNSVTIEAALSEFGPEETKAITQTLIKAATSVEAVERAHVEQATPGMENRTKGVGDVDRIVAVASVKGGVGKTTVATHLATALSAEGPTGLFDGDIHGPNVPELLSIAGPVYSDDDGNPIPVKNRNLEVMSIGLMESGAPLGWRGAMAHDALSDLFENTAWDDCETLVIDLPPGTGDVVLTTLQEVPVDAVVVVTTPFHAAVSDTQRSLELFRENDVPVLGVVVNMADFTCQACGHEHDLFPDGDPTASLDAPILARLPFDHSIQKRPDPADPPAELGDLVDSVTERYDAVWDVEVPDHALDIRGVPPEERRERVEEHVAALGGGDEFLLVSDRDPSPVQQYLAQLVTGEAEKEDPDEVDPGIVFGSVEIKQQNPETWFLRTELPGGT
jgi:ATP-binding protein involved in chromosome partitioning